MNILLINHYAGSPEMGMEFRPYYLAQEWIRRGHSVTIIAGDYSHLRKHNPEISEDFTEEVIDGIQYLWVKTGKYEGNGVARALTMFRFCRKLSSRKKKIVDKIHPDVVISSSTYPLDSYPAEKIARLAGAKYIHEVHDMWPSTLYEAGGMSRYNPFVVLMQVAENHAYKKADDVVSLLSNAKEYMVKHGMAPNKFHYIPNGVIVEEWETEKQIPLEHQKAFDELRKEHKFIIGYFGSHELSYGLFNLLTVAKTVESENIEIVFVGNGSLKDELVKYAKENKINNVLFLPPVVKSEIPAITSNFDLIFIGTIKSPLYRFGICMNKMFDAMMAGKPIIMAITTPSTPVSESGCGIVTDSCDNKAIIGAIHKMVSMSENQRYEIGQKGKKAIMSEYTYEKIGEQFNELFD